MKEKIFGAQGSPEQIKDAEQNNLTEEQKIMSDERAAILEHGFDMGKKFMVDKKILSKEIALEILNDKDYYEINMLTPSGAIRRIDGKIDDMFGIECGHLRIDGQVYPLNAATKILNTDTNKVVWNNVDETYDGFVNKQEKTKK